MEPATPVHQTAAAEAAAPGGLSIGATVRARGAGVGRPSLEAYVFLMPALFLLGVFLVWPTIYVFWLSAFKWDLISQNATYNFPFNYQRLWRDDLWWQSLRQTIYFVVGTVPTGMALSLFLAVLLNAKIPARGFLRAVIYSPYVTPVVATTILWQWIYNADYGLFNALLQAVHLPRLPWVRSPDWIMPAIIIYSIWHHTGYSTVIFLSGLVNIPPEVLEAARVDGANRWHTFWKVTWPLLTPTTYFVLFISMIGSFKVFTQVFIFTSGTGGPNNAALVVGVYLYQQAFTYFRAGYASAISVALFLIIVLVTAVQMRLVARRVFYG
jgi:ABC-type sugar transport system permease subunit